MSAEASWRLKLNRAEKHLEEIDAEILRYADTHPYRAVRDPKQKRNSNLWRYRLRIDQTPDPELAVIFGDVIHNIRSALDHLAVGISDRERNYQAGFPIQRKNIWAKEGRPFVFGGRDGRNKRRSFNSAIAGMTPEAATIIKRLQPYQHGPMAAAIDPLAMVAGLENADKHRQLVTIVPGVNRATAHVLARGRVINQFAQSFCEDGAIVAEFGEDFSPPLQDGEVDVNLYGAPAVAVKVAETDWHVDVTQLRFIVQWLRDSIFPPLEAARHLKARHDR